MQSVDLHVNRAGFGESLGDLRRWLDHHDCTRRHLRLGPRGHVQLVLVHIEFREDEDAEAFERDFGAYIDA